MARLLLRLGGRAEKAAWEARDIDEVLVREFELRAGGPDLTPSVYELSAATAEACRAQAVQIQAEHGASFLGDPPRRIVDVDVGGLVDPADVSPTPGETLFTFANCSHRELHLAAPADLRRLVENILVDWPRRHVGVTRAEVLAYVAARLDAKDPEWLLATGEEMKAHRWLKYCKPFRTAPP